MKKVFGSLDRPEPRSPSFSGKKMMAVFGLVASLVLCGFAPTAGFAVSILSFRAGLLPGGVRLVIDLDESAECSATADASTVLLDMNYVSRPRPRGVPR